MGAELETIDLVPTGGRPSRVVVGPGALAATDSLPVEALVADEHVLALHGERLPPAWRARVLRLPRGEAAKTWGVLGETLEGLADLGLERRARIAVLGGGAATDLGGLAAALYLRGIAVVSCPTSLLAMVDASVGGKTAVNLTAGKNLAGTFWQPDHVLADTDLLATLDPAEFQSGLGEVLKTAVLAGEPLLSRLEAVAESLASPDGRPVAPLVADCVRFKAEVVAADEREAGRRAILNLGHTVGHAIEAVAGFGSIPHGTCVAAGLGAALELARRTGDLEDPLLPERVASLARRLGLPASLADLRRSSGDSLAPDALHAAMGHDKKRDGGQLRFVLPHRAGAVAHGRPVPDALVASVLAGRDA
ncbi:MAG: 3-dehydroquinate synthase family protein [Planctomycetota bacterium]